MTLTFPLNNITIDCDTPITLNPGSIEIHGVPGPTGPAGGGDYKTETLHWSNSQFDSVGLVTGIVHVAKLYNIVTLHFVDKNPLNIGDNGTIGIHDGNFGPFLPEEYRPNETVAQPIFVVNGGQEDISYVVIHPNGTGEIMKNFASISPSLWHAFSVAYFV
jgi:hypothetical protein